ncbi:DUF5683 domain-containing protein [Mucilaginibacter sp. UR6-11]|uniref:DUF5683 domain-containing protein n=1 Tax=Mucilaginibacter sp. UR6-11 TaxID=1435644 RepID=UPI001E3BD655|nr:DUF5683 domain-containing protein [Mucilaginibacter sp. UR6-11]MCC8424320.1 DUF5683 domain-containing protein [Mucilaginibacter sp. UR6-11]
MQRYILIIGLLTGFVFSAMAQAPVLRVKTKADSIQEKRDSLKSKPFAPKASTEKVYHPDSTHSPSTAWHRSVFVPGLGQVYNRKYWKVPIIYTGLTLLVVMYRFNEQAYTEDLAIARYRAKGTQPSPGDKYYQLYVNYTGYPDNAINDAVRGYARYRDLSVLLFAAAWGIQTIDAYVDAKFMHSYSMDNNFSVKVVPTVINQPAQSFASAFIPGLKVTFTLR